VNDVAGFLLSRGITHLSWVYKEEIDGAAFQKLEFSHLFDMFKAGPFGICNKILSWKETHSLVPTPDELKKISLSYWGAAPIRSVSEATPPNVSDIVQTISETRQRRLEVVAEKKARKDKRDSMTIEIKDMRSSKKGKAYLISVNNSEPTWNPRSSISKKFLPVLDEWEKKNELNGQVK